MLKLTNQRLKRTEAMNKKRGVSAVVATVVLILMVVSVSAIVWVTVNNLIKSRISSSQSCFGILDKVSINKANLCYDNANKKVIFSIELGDINVDGVLVVLSGAEETKSIMLNNSYQNIPNLVNYSGGGTLTKLPDKNSGITYNYTWTTTAANHIDIAPIINRNRCDASDSAEIHIC